MSRSKEREQISEILDSLPPEALTWFINYHIEKVLETEKAEVGRKLFLSGYTQCRMQDYNLSLLLNRVLLPDLDEIQTAWFHTVEKAFPVYLNHMYGEKENAK